MHQQAPNLLRLINSLAGGNPMDSTLENATPSNDIGEEEHVASSDPTVRKRERHVVLVLAELAKLRNDHTNFIQAMIALYMYASNVPKRVLTMLSHVGFSVSYSTLQRFLKSAASAASKRLKEVAAAGYAYIPVFDNLNRAATVKDFRLFNDESFLSMVCGFILIPPESRAQRMHTHTDIRRHLVDELRLEDFLPTDKEYSHLQQAFRSVLGDVLAGYAKFIDKSISTADVVYPMPEIYQIDQTQPPTILPLPTIDLNETDAIQMVEILYTIQDRVGMSEEQCKENVIMNVGDYLTVQNTRYPRRRFNLTY